MYLGGDEEDGLKEGRDACEKGGEGDGGVEVGAAVVAGGARDGEVDRAEHDGVEQVEREHRHRCTRARPSGDVQCRSAGCGVVVNFSVHGGRMHHCSMHQCSMHHCSMHHCSMHHCSMHHCSMHHCSMHHCSMHHCSMHQAIETAACITAACINLHCPPCCERNVMQLCTEFSQHCASLTCAEPQDVLRSRHVTTVAQLIYIYIYN